MEEKERLEKARGYYILGKDKDKQMLADIFPELRESEDERIRKWIIDLLGSFRTKDRPTECLQKLDEAIAWLEKQKEPKEELFVRINGLINEYIKAGADEAEQEHRLKCYHLFLDSLEDAEYFEQEEQKLKENSVYPYSLDEAIQLYYYTYGNGKGGFDYLSLPKFQDIVEEFVKDYSQNFTEWSEEDEENLKRVIRVLEDNESDWKELSDWLKSLRPQPRWKPSEEQMVALDTAIACVFSGQTMNTLQSLYNDLQKHYDL